MKKIFLVLICYLLYIQTVQARDFNILSQTEFGYGGDPILIDSNGDDIMNSGDGFNFSIGTIFNTFKNRKDLHTALTIGWTFSWKLIEDADDFFLSNIPLTITEYYTIKNWRFGAGITYHVANRFQGSESIPDIKFDNAFGSVFSAGYLINRAKSNQTGLKVTIIDYSVNGFSGSGNRFAIFFESQY